ncbi:MAG: VanZ family protein [Actinomycetota bacterium]|nr:VanZ family protein [Actinomycetota bacterium]
MLAIFRRHSTTAWITCPTIEFTATVLMFVLVGLFLLLLLGRRLWWLAVVMGALLSSLIEFTQLFLPGRVSDVRDLMSNSLGALFGVLLALVVTWPAAARRRRAARPQTGGIRVA